MPLFNFAIIILQITVVPVIAVEAITITRISYIINVTNLTLLSCEDYKNSEAMARVKMWFRSHWQSCNIMKIIFSSSNLCMSTLFSAFQHHCGDVKGQILISPVDGFDPYGWIQNYIITPGEYLNYAMPTLGMFHTMKFSM